ncbi:ATP-dependent protease ATP-binding subunit-like protein AmiB [Frankliniella fusca]|uniref:ATP-dependent protease ATP-binding subunit-like protein AmiB n=1 Tax=Frankliniella fusca TaxID=407009 RepID=A0AAE1LR55_9NEOP|nr:ATP-dependent protease ATP-binding subunit-like protein AmiB [Frankliniella fusca]
MSVSAGRGGGRRGRGGGPPQGGVGLARGGAVRRAGARAPRVRRRLARPGPVLWAQRHVVDGHQPGAPAQGGRPGSPRVLGGCLLCRRFPGKQVCNYGDPRRVQHAVQWVPATGVLESRLNRNRFHGLPG